MNTEGIWWSLHETGLHCVLCAKSKRAIAPAWQETAATWQEVKTHVEAGGLVGVVPGSAGWWVLDQDLGDKSIMREAIPEVAFSIPSSADGRWHHWIRKGRVKNDPNIGNKKWRWGSCSGEVRGDRGYVIVWHPDQLLEGLLENKLSKGIHPLKTCIAPKTPELKIKPGVKKTAPVSANDYAHLQIERMRRMQKGERNNMLNNLVYDVYCRGLAFEGFDEEIFQAAMEAGLDETGAKLTIASASGAGAIKHDSDKHQAEEDKASDGSKPAVPLDGRQILDQIVMNGGGGAIYSDTKLSTIEQALLGLGYRFRFNTLSARPEVCRDDEEWVDVSNGGSKIRRELEDRCMVATKKGAVPFRVQRDRFDDLMMSLEEDSEYHHNPLTLWAESLPAWDGKDRLSALFTETLGTPRDPLTEWSGNYLLTSVLLRAMCGDGPGYSLDQMLFLIGPHGIGKSRFVREVVPPEHSEEWVSQRFNLSWDEKRQIEAIVGKVFVEVAEVHISKNFSLNDFKAFLSSTCDETRLAFRRRTINYPRTATLIGTLNEQQGLPNDPTGNRRFVPLWCPGVKQSDGREGGFVVADWWQQNRDQAWAQAMDAARKVLRGDGSMEMSAGAKARLRDAYDGAREMDYDVEDVISDMITQLIADEAADQGKWPGIKLSMLLRRLRDNSISSPNLERRVQAVLRQQGYGPVQLKRGGENQRRWVLSEA